jgi:hypothetical protein
MKLKSQQAIFPLAVLVGVMLPLAPVRSQTVAPDLAKAAQDACINVAQSRGFTLDRVIAVQADGVDAAKAVLSLTRNGQAFRLTCGYSRTKGAIFGSDAPSTSTQVPAPTIPQPSVAVPAVPVPAVPAPAVPVGEAPDLSRLWWLLLPLIGLPLLLWWTRRRGEQVVGRTYEAYEGIVRKVGGVNIHSGPGATHGVTGSLQDGQRVVLSGRHDNNWTQLQEGGWIPSETIETSRYATR